MQQTRPGIAPRTLALAAAAVLVLDSGCTTVAPPSPSLAVRDNLGVVAIIPANYVPESNFITFAKGEGTGAAKGPAIEWGKAAAGVAVVTAVAAPIAVPVILLAGALATAAMAAHGAWSGAQDAVPALEAKRVESVINEAVARLDAQNAPGRSACNDREGRPVDPARSS